MNLPTLHNSEREEQKNPASSKILNSCQLDRKIMEEEWRVNHQIVVPRLYRNESLGMAHEMPFAGHLGVNRILNHFYWPKL